MNSCLLHILDCPGGGIRQPEENSLENPILIKYLPWLNTCWVGILFIVSLFIGMTVTMQYLHPDFIKGSLYFQDSLVSFPTFLFSHRWAENWPTLKPVVFHATQSQCSNLTRILEAELELLSLLALHSIRIWTRTC